MNNVFFLHKEPVGFIKPTGSLLYVYIVSTLIRFELPLLPFGVPPVMTIVSPFCTKPLFLAVCLAK